MQTILFIGGAGFIGSNLIRRFCDGDGWRVVVVEPPAANLDRLSGLENVEIVRGTLADTTLLSELIERRGITIVVHLVSTLLPGSGFEEYRGELSQIILPSVDLTALCAKKGVLFVFLSSGGTIYGSGRGRSFRETDIAAPICHYGLSKQMLEDNILLAHRREGLRHLIVRPSNPYGPGQSTGGRQGLVAVALGRILSGRPISIWGDGSSVRDYIYIDDLTKVLHGLIVNGVENEIVNIGSGCGHSINEVVACIREVCSDRTVTVEHRPGRDCDVDSIVLNVDKLQSYLKIPATPLRDGIRKFYEHLNSAFR
jgi:UDP-glucose 4-epimerase